MAARQRYSFSLGNYWKSALDVEVRNAVEVKHTMEEGNGNEVVEVIDPCGLNP